MTQDYADNASHPQQHNSFLQEFHTLLIHDVIDPSSHNFNHSNQAANILSPRYINYLKRVFSEKTSSATEDLTTLSAGPANAAQSLHLQLRIQESICQHLESQLQLQLPQQHCNDYAASNHDFAHEQSLSAPEVLTERTSMHTNSTQIANLQRQIAEMQDKFEQELKHALTFKFLFADIAMQKEDLEVALEEEKNKTRKNRAFVDKCLRAHSSLEQEQERLAATVAQLAHQLIEQGIPVKSTEPIASSSTTSNPSESFNSVPRSLTFTAAEQHLVDELLNTKAGSPPTTASSIPTSAASSSKQSTPKSWWRTPMRWQ